jgi:hypothetical protein
MFSHQEKKYIIKSNTFYDFICDDLTGPNPKRWDLYGVSHNPSITWEIWQDRTLNGGIGMEYLEIQT